MRAIYLLFSIMGVLLLGGCATGADSRRVTAHACCATYDQASTIPLALDEPMEASLAENSDTMVLSMGLAYFVELELPNQARSMEVQSINGGLLPVATYVDPVLVFLDHEKKVVEVMTGLPLRRGRFRHLGLFWKYYHGARIVIPAKARYVAVLGDPASHRTQAAYSESGREWWLPASPTGEIRVIAYAD
jgi:hypothetical protein